MLAHEGWLPRSLVLASPPWVQPATPTVLDVLWKLTQQRQLWVLNPQPCSCRSVREWATKGQAGQDQTRLGFPRLCPPHRHSWSRLTFLNLKKKEKEGKASSCTHGERQPFRQSTCRQRTGGSRAPSSGKPWNYAPLRGFSSPPLEVQVKLPASHFLHSPSSAGRYLKLTFGKHILKAFGARWPWGAVIPLENSPRGNRDAPGIATAK